MTWRGQFFTTM